MEPRIEERENPRARRWRSSCLSPAHGLNKDYVQKLPESVRPVYLNCYDNMVEEDRYEKEMENT